MNASSMHAGNSSQTDDADWRTESAVIFCSPELRCLAASIVASGTAR